MTVKNLLDLLAAMPADAEVFVASDAEGNRIRATDAASTGRWAGRLPRPKSLEDFRFQDSEPHRANAVILWPAS